MICIQEYIQKPKEDRQQHLSLDEECLEIGGFSTHYRGLLAYYLGTTLPSGNKILLCHACNNSKCCNPKHLYWGTPKENVQDAKEAGTHQSIYERAIAKYGKETYREMARSGGLASKQRR